MYTGPGPGLVTCTFTELRFLDQLPASRACALPSGGATRGPLLKKTADPFMGQWTCRRVAYERSDELLSRSESEDLEDEKPPQPAAKTEFSKATLSIDDDGRFAVSAPEIAATAVVTGTWKKKGK